MMGYQENKFDIFICFDTTHECGGQTATSADGWYCAYA